MLTGVSSGSWKLLGVAAGSLVAVGLLFHIERSGDGLDGESAASRKTGAKAVVAATVARIAKEGAGTFAPAEVVPAPIGNTIVNPASAPVDHPVAPPDGYSFVEFHGQLSKAALQRVESVPPGRMDQRFEWLDTPASLDALVAQAARAGRDWSFGWIRLAEEARADGLARALRGTGAEIVGTSGRLLRARLPGDKTRLQAIAAMSEVDGLGAAPAATKLKAVVRQSAARVAHAEIPVFVSLMAGDANGRWRRELESLGAVIGRYDPAIRVYEGNATYKVLKAIAATDFVMAVEPVGIVEAAHDTAVPAMGADALRLYQGSPGFYSGVGGARVPIAVMDTGLNVNHLDIASNRSSICGANLVYTNPLVDEEDLWLDAHGHGTHVTGTIAGNGTVQPRHAGMAPLVRHLRFAKVLNHFGSGNVTSILRGMDFLAASTACPETGWSSDSVKPLIVNMSLAADSRVFEGRTVAERKLDAVVWGRRQLYVVANSNSSIHGFSNYGAAKNSLAVGAAMDSGALASFSSHGPTADGRLAPQVVGTGVALNSAAGDGSRGGYRESSGTSMASPAVAGVAALLMDAAPAHRERPALARARLMASAVKPDAWMADATVFPNNNSNGPGTLQMQYGLGKVSARTSVLNRNQPDGWTSGSAISELEDGDYAYHDIEVPEGASRLDVVLTWDEPPADTLASTVLNDLDLWLDQGGDCEAEPCGEYASESRVDNVEWIVVRNPAPGTYRAKVAASRVYTDAPRAALAWTTIRGASTPTLQIAVDRELVEVAEREEERELTLKLTADEYVAAGTRLQVDCRSAGGSGCRRWERVRLTAEREDDVTRDFELWFGESIELGELAAGETWTAKIAFGNLADGDAQAFRLYFKASAWNANAVSTSILSRTAGTDDTVREAATPANDLFANAAMIEGGEGAAELDLLGARVEPGEPVFLRWTGRPAGSVWYQWTAPSDDMVSFGVTPDAADDFGDKARVDVFRGASIAALEPVASSDWGAQFFAESGQVYRIRVSHGRRAAALTLKWSKGSRPSNDDFVAAAALDGASGSAKGTNEGATLEAGEFFGDLAATVWYRWTAPNDGVWQFESSTSELRVLAFAGERLADLRLVSGFARDRAEIPARGGEVYRIAVASQNATASGRTYELAWDTADRERGNDDFGGAQEIPSEASSHRVGMDEDATVEPGEPAESGIRTKWWSWTAPSDGRYAWRLDELTRPTSRPGSRLMVSVFTGESLDDLELAATNGTRMSGEFALDAVGGTRYWISAGLPAADQWAFTGWDWGDVGVTLVWGPAPGNDEEAGAVVISGASGSVSGSNAFATGGGGERSDVFGRWTLWWTYEATASGWVRFAVDGAGGPWALTVHQAAADGSGLDILATDRWQRQENEVLFEAREGVRYRIALGVRGGGRGGEFTLRWAEAENPGWLRYAGRLADGHRDSRGNPVEIRNPGDIAMNAGGTALYLASGIGLQVFERDGTTGDLDYVQLLETDFDLAAASLLWHPQHDRLLADNCGDWRWFAPLGNGPELEDLGALAAVDEPGSCAEHLLLDGSGSNVYRVSPRRVERFAIDDGGALRFSEFIEVAGPQVLRAVLSNGGEYLYAATYQGVLVFQRDSASGRLTKADYNEMTLSAPARAPVPLAITDDDAYLFAFDQDGQQANLFSLDDPLNPVRLAKLPKFWDAPWQSDWCRFGDARHGQAVVDVFCPGVAFTARWDAAARRLEGSDSITQNDVDRYNSAPLPDFAGPVGFAVSPDESHLYLSTKQHGIVIIERGGSPGAGTTF